MQQGFISSDIWVAAVLGIVEGVTEFLPVSSTGHLIVAANLLHFEGPTASCFEIFIQLGAIVAVVFLYWRRFLDLVPMVVGRKKNSGNKFSGRRGLTLLSLTTLPALIIGFFAHHAIKEYLFTPMTVAWALGLGGVAILVVERYRPQPSVLNVDGLTYKQAVIIGFFQCLAMWPGVSRSASTIVGGLLCGVDRKAATEYSFLAAVPVMVAAVTYDLYKGWHLLSASDLGFFLVGFVVSFISAAVAVKTFIALVQRWSLAPYAWYRIAISPFIYFGMR